MTPKQETFDIVVRGVLAQGEPSLKQLRTGLACAYRGDNGCKCAAGQLIPDDKYDPAFENVVVRSLVEDTTGQRDVLHAALIDHDLALVADLQGAHDGAAFGRERNYTGAEFIDRFRSTALEIAREHGLSSAVVSMY